MATHITVHWDLCKNQIVVNNLRFVAQWWTLGEGHLLSETVLWDLCRSIYISWPCQPPSTPFNWDLCGSIYEDSWRCNRFNMEPSWGSFDLKPPEKAIQILKREIFIGRLLYSDHFPKYSFDVCHIMLHTKSLQVMPKNTMSVFFLRTLIIMCFNYHYCEEGHWRYYGFSEGNSCFRMQPASICFPAEGKRKCTRPILGNFIFIAFRTSQRANFFFSLILYFPEE